MECVASTEFPTFSDDIALTDLTTATLAQYLAINFAGHSTSNTQTVTINSVAYTVDTQMTTLKLNQYTKNTGSGGLGLIDIKGVPRVQFVSE